MNGGGTAPTSPSLEGPEMGVSAASPNRATDRLHYENKR